MGKPSNKNGKQTKTGEGNQGRKRDIKKAGPYMVLRGGGRGEVSNKEPQEPSDRSWHFYLEQLTNS